MRGMRGAMDRARASCRSWRSSTWATSPTPSGWPPRARSRLPQHVDFVLGVPGGLEASVEYLVDLVRALPPGCTWSVAGIGRMQLTLATVAIAMGGHVRVGLEDNLYYSKGRLARNEELVARVVRIADELGRPVATPDEARRLLKLRTAARRLTVSEETARLDRNARRSRPRGGASTVHVRRPPDAAEHPAPAAGLDRAVHDPPAGAGRPAHAVPAEPAHHRRRHRAAQAQPRARPAGLRAVLQVAGPRAARATSAGRSPTPSRSPRRSSSACPPRWS